MYQYRELQLRDAERIAEINATHFVKNVWRKDASGEYRLLEINWTETELPNGFAWHLRRFREALENSGTAFGCIDGDKLIGYAVMNGNIFSQQSYVLLDQLFVSNSYRGKGIGRKLFTLCVQQARQLGAGKLYLCAASAEDTIAFYHKLGCVPAAEPDEKLAAEDSNDIQLEYTLGG